MTTSQVLIEIADERIRQMEMKGFTRQHDDEHDGGELAAAAAAYALNASDRLCSVINNDIKDELAAKAPDFWPWHARYWKPKDARRDMIRAAAMLVAEIERMDRSGQKR